MFFYKNIILLIFLGIYAIGHNVLAQTVSRYYVNEYSQFAEQYALRNPAYVQSDSMRYIQLAYKGFNSASAYLRGIYGLAQLRLDREKRAVFNINFSSDQEGVFIRQTKIHTGYSHRVKLSYRSSLSAGINMGIFNYFIDGNGIVDGLSRIKLDAALGMKYMLGKYHLGLSLSHVTGGRFKLYTGENVMVREYYISTGYDFKKLPDRGMRVDVYTRLPNEISTFSTWLVVDYSFASFLHSSIVLNDFNTLAPAVELKWNVHKMRAGLQFVYQVPLKIRTYQVVNSNNIEIILKGYL